MLDWADAVWTTARKAFSDISALDREMFIEKHPLRDAVGTLHIKLFLALQEYGKEQMGEKECQSIR